MNLSDLIRATGPLLGLPELTLNAEGVCALQMDGGVPVILENSPLGETVLYAEVAQVPNQGRESYYASLLEAQLFGREVPAGCSFGLRADTGGVYLNRVFDTEGFDAAQFFDLLTEFNRWANHWHEKLSGIENTNARDEHEPDGMAVDRSQDMGLRI